MSNDLCQMSLCFPDSPTPCRKFLGFIKRLHFFAIHSGLKGCKILSDFLFHLSLIETQNPTVPFQTVYSRMLYLLLVLTVHGPTSGFISHPYRCTSPLHSAAFCKYIAESISFRCASSQEGTRIVSHVSHFALLC